MLKLACKYQDRTFATRNHMLAYMTKAFQNAITAVFGNVDIDIKYFQKALKIEEARQNTESQYVGASSSQTNLEQTEEINEHGNMYKLR